MSLAALARQMFEAGTPMEGILLALEAVEARDNAAAAKRAQAAARKQAQRDRERDCHATVTGHVSDNPPLDKEKRTKKEINPPRTHTHETPVREADLWVCPEGVNPAHWRDFMKARKRKHCVTTPTAHAGVMNDLARLADEEWPPGRLVELAAAKGWASINYPDEGLRNGSARNKIISVAGSRGSSVTGFGRTGDAAARFAARS